MSITREEARKRTTSRRYTVESLSDGTQVRLRSVTRSERRECRKAVRKPDGSEDKTKADMYDDVFLSYGLVDANGERLFSTHEALDGCFDSFCSLGDSMHLVEVVMELSDMIREPTSTGAALKNSETGQRNDSSGDSSGPQD